MGGGGGERAHFAIRGKEGERRQGWERLPPPSSDGPSRTACPRDNNGGEAGGHRAVRAQSGARLS